MDDEFEEDPDEILNNRIRQERMRMMREGYLDNEPGGADDPENVYGALDFEDVQGPLSLWLQRRDVIRFINR